ncbi:MAG: hypothetical protein ACTSO9_05645 [Candidatus Helarchaeota archaeon]
MLYSVFLMERASGRMLYSKQFGKIKIDENLLSGFLTALDGFARGEFKESGIENIDMGGIRWVYLDEKGVLYVSASEKEDTPEMLKNQLMAISAAFNDYFSIENSFSELNWDGNIHRFTPFNEILEQLIRDWEKAKKVQDAATLMDVLDVYQQIITALGTSVNLGSEFSLNIMEMAFEEESGSWDIEKLAEIDQDEFRERLKNILQNFLILIKETLGSEQLFKSIIRTDIYPILKNDWRRIRELNIDEFIIQTLL